MTALQTVKTCCGTGDGVFGDATCDAQDLRFYGEWTDRSYPIDALVVIRGGASAGLYISVETVSIGSPAPTNPPAQAGPWVMLTRHSSLVLVTSRGVEGKTVRGKPIVITLIPGTDKREPMIALKGERLEYRGTISDLYRTLAFWHANAERSAKAARKNGIPWFRFDWFLYFSCF